MNSKLINFCWEILSMALASVNFLGGLYLAFKKENMAISIVLVFVALVLAFAASYFDIIIEEEEFENSTTQQCKRAA